MQLSNEKTKFLAGDVVYDGDDKYVVRSYHMPHVEIDGKHSFKNNGMVDCQSLSTGEIVAKSEHYLTQQGEYDIYRVGNVVRVFDNENAPFGGMATIVQITGDTYLIKENSSGTEASSSLFDKAFIPFWMDQTTLKKLGFIQDGKNWSNGVVQLISAKVDVVSDDPKVNYFEAIRNYGYEVRIIKEDMRLLIIPEHAENVIRAVHELQNIYTSPNIRSVLDISGLLK